MCLDVLLQVRSSVELPAADRAFVTALLLVDAAEVHPEVVLPREPLPTNEAQQRRGLQQQHKTQGQKGQVSKIQGHKGQPSKTSRS